MPETNQMKTPNTPKIMGGEVPIGIVRNTPTKQQKTRPSELSLALLRASRTREIIFRPNTSIPASHKVDEAMTTPS